MLTLVECCINLATDGGAGPRLCQARSAILLEDGDAAPGVAIFRNLGRLPKRLGRGFPAPRPQQQGTDLGAVLLLATASKPTGWIH